MKINSERIRQDYNKIRNLAINEIKSEQWNKACSYMQRAAKFMYNFNVIFTDKQLEEAVATMAERCIKKTKFSLYNKKDITQRRLVFYDFFVIDNAYSMG